MGYLGLVSAVLFISSLAAEQCRPNFWASVFDILKQGLILTMSTVQNSYTRISSSEWWNHVLHTIVVISYRIFWAFFNVAWESFEIIHYRQFFPLQFQCPLFFIIWRMIFLSVSVSPSTKLKKLLVELTDGVQIKEMSSSKPSGCPMLLAFYVHVLKRNHIVYKIGIGKACKFIYFSIVHIEKTSFTLWGILLENLNYQLVLSFFLLSLSIKIN